MKVKLTVAYDGTNYHGWQIQPNGVTIQEKLNEAACALFQQPVMVTGASRTDAGVHALGNVAAFDVETRMPAERIMPALNQRLPEDIRVQASQEVPPDFQPRYDAKKKTYEYRILNRSCDLPTKRLYQYFYHHPLDIERMRAAAVQLTGEHDFTSFASVHAQTKTFVRTLYTCDVWTEPYGTISVHVEGSGFLYHMVRIIAGTLIQIGSGRLEPEDIAVILEKRDRSFAGPTAPPQGLTLCKIEY